MIQFGTLFMLTRPKKVYTRSCPLFGLHFLIKS
ncbi:MAG: hypothetical protein JWR50_2758 [Mucilaginibacter sp.]|nr:hypothetical protein [Mucilaginibacter sp.]